MLNKWYHKFYTIRGHFQLASMLPAKFVFWKFDFVSVSISSFSFSLFSDDEGDKGGVPEKKYLYVGLKKVVCRTFHKSRVITSSSDQVPKLQIYESYFHEF